jgi:uncharacterized protein
MRNDPLTHPIQDPEPSPQRRAALRAFAWSPLAAAAAFSLLGGLAHAGPTDDFFRAVERGDDRSVAALLQRGVDPNSVDERGQVGLYLALRDDANSVLDVLLAQPGIQVDMANRSNETPLMMAALRGNLPAVQKLVARGAALARAGWTPLHYAASGPSLEVMAWLVGKGAPLEALSPNRTTPLMMAAGYGNADGADLFLKAGANPRARNDAGLDAAAFARRVSRDALAQRIDKAAELAAKP